MYCYKLGGVTYLVLKCNPIKLYDDYNHITYLDDNGILRGNYRYEELRKIIE